MAERLTHNFNSILEETNGGTRDYDGFVLTNQIGATQFTKTAPEYIKEVIRHSDNNWKLFDGVPDEDVEHVFFTYYLEREFARKGIHFGFSRYKNIPASFATFRRWLDNGKMALMPHDDVAQLKQAARDRFEIGLAERVISFNACIEAPELGGNLTVWNIHPDEECRTRCGVMETGYPYDIMELGRVEKLELQLNSGDVYFMNASHVHGVSSLNKGRRLTAGRFIGEVRKDKVVFWT
ncbi:hypothetical protein DDT56_14165 [Brenneria corticis]|uniref:Fe2OG dioxygenase domain-containing protein n=1 Tax=Brenneria corticis TaxID=2173106 RepID=A0A2U1TXG0_9GAMM|nr:hypothetical protein DDT56_14165 [Brenneria sp. CFCC 11842]